MAASSSIARSTLAALPRALRISPSTPVTRNHLLALYKEQLRVANSFSSYNFKEYFVRRTKEKFRVEVPILLEKVEQAASGTSSEAGGKVVDALKAVHAEVESKSSETAVEEEPSGSIYTPTSSATLPTTVQEAQTPEDALRAWYAESLQELSVMARSAIVNQMYEAPRLVVEGVGRVMAVGGGGAGADAG